MCVSVCICVTLSRRGVCMSQYTASNGAPSSPESLHFINGRSFNEYQAAIQTVGEILMARPCALLLCGRVGVSARASRGRVHACFS